MKFIKKLNEPEIFRNWKALADENWQPTWDTLRSVEKRQLHQSLLQEQGYICCYCGQRISQENSHIEHLKPRTAYPELALEYTNLLASCKGEQEEPPFLPVHCGHLKKDWYDEQLMVSPLDKNCKDYFAYTELGEILPCENLEFQKSPQQTIEKLGLNIPKLIAMRKKAIEAILDGLDDLTEPDYQKLIEGFEQINDETGQYQEFCAALVYILESFCPNK